MSRPVSSERPKSSGRTYTDEEWERVKQPFHYYYMEKNMSLKDAARYLSEHHGFDATLRQWERRIAPEKWGFSKYASREDRLKAIDASGKSLLDVSQRGRRKSTASDGRPSLTEDRNLRRFARREVSRESRGRARSVSVLSDQSDQDMSDNSAAQSPSPSDLMMDAQDSSSFSQPNFTLFGQQWYATSSQDQAMDIPEIRVFGEVHEVPQINISGPEDAYVAPEQIPLSMQAQVSIRYPDDDSSNTFTTFQSHGSDRFDVVQPQTAGHDRSEMAENISSADYNWSEPFVSQIALQNPQPRQDLASFGFDNESSMSYTEMLQLNSENAALDANRRSEAFDNQASLPQESVMMPDPTLEFDPDFDDPTHVDVFALLKERDRRIIQMIGMLKQSYGNSTNPEHTTKHVINSIDLLEKGIQAQNTESERDVRRTLKNISSTQRRATQDIHLLSTQRRQKIKQLQAQLEALNANQHSSFPYS